MKRKLPHNKNRFIKKLLIFWGGVLGLIIILLILLVTSSKFQTFAAKQVASYFSKEWQVDIKIQRIHLGFLDDIGIEQIYISDQNKDTLAFINYLGLVINDFSLRKRYIDINRITINEAFFNYRKDTISSNLRFLIDYFSASDTLDSSNFSVTIHKILLKNSRVRYQSLPKKNNNNHPINYRNLYFSSIYGIFDDISIDSTQIKTEIKKLHFKEQCGWQINQFDGNVCLLKEQLKVIKLSVITKKSKIYADSLILNFRSMNDFLDFTNKIRINAHFQESLLDFSDLVYFSNGIKSFRQHFSFSGNIKGKISNLKTKDLKITWGVSSNLNISGRISGLPDLNNTFLYVDITNLHTSKDDIDNLLIFAGEQDSLRQFHTPKIISQLGKINYKGNITGFYNDMVAYGNFNTDLGNFTTDISLKQDPATDKITYKGFLTTKEFDAGKFLGKDSLIGNITLKGMINGFSIGKENFVEMNTEIQSLLFNNYLYHNISINGMWRNEGFSGNIFVQDTNLEMSFTGNVDISEEKTIFDFTSEINKAYLNKLFLISDSSVRNIECRIDANMTGSTIEELNGSLTLTDGMIYTGDTTYPINNLKLLITKNEETKQLKLQSEIIDFFVKLNLPYLNILPFTYQQLAKYYSFLPLKETINFDTTTFIEGNLKLKQSGLFNYLFNNSVIFSNNTNLNFNINNKKNNGLKFHFFAPDLCIKDKKIIKPKFSGNSTPENLHFIMHATKINFANNIVFKQVYFDSWLINDTANVSLILDFSDTTIYSADLQAQISFEKQLPYNPKISINLLPSYFVFRDTIWYLNEAHLTIDTERIAVKGFMLNHENEYLYANGGFSFLYDDTLNLLLNDFNIEHFNNFLKSYHLNLHGKINGNTLIISKNHSVAFFSNLNIPKLTVNNEQFGKTILKSIWDKHTKNIHINLFTQRGKIKPIQISGNYTIEARKLDFDIVFNKLLLRTFESMMQDNLHDLKGIASGKLSLKGYVDKPLLEGIINLQKTSFIVDYLNTKYNLTTPVFVSIDGFRIKDATLNDDITGKSAILNASLTHHFFKDFKYDVSLKSDNFLFLNTTEDENPLYYGTVFANGIVNINGNFNLININADIQTSPQTIFNLSLSSSEEAEEYHFVQFVKHKKDSIEIKPDIRREITGINLNIDIDATEDATVKLIFDKKTGDVIKAKGSGNINFKMDRFGKMNMIGNYTISEGNYLFTLENIINKRFKIERGGSIKWNGDPYKAFLNIDAVYALKTSLYDLTLDSLDKKKIPVECRMKILGQLSDPKIQFEINLPNRNNNAEAILSSMSQNEISKQILTLLLLNRFYTPENMVASESYRDINQTSALGINTSELLSNQMSNWLSQISNNFDVGIKYTPGNEITRDELEVALSTQIFNDRLLINGNVSTGGGVMGNSSTVAGDLSMELKINKSGNLRLKGYNKSNANDLLLYQDSPYTQGIGLYYTKEFNSLNELIEKYLKYLKKIISDKYRKTKQ